MKDKLLALLKGLPLSVYLVAGGIAVAGSWLAINNAYQRGQGAQAVLTEQAKVGEQAARDSLKKLTALQKPQTAAAVKWLTKYDTTTREQLRVALATLQALGEQKPETVTVATTVGALATADSAITSCTEARLTCDQRVGIAQTGWDHAEDRIKILEKLKPSAITPWKDRAVGGAVVGVIVYLLGRVR